MKPAITMNDSGIYVGDPELKEILKMWKEGGALRLDDLRRVYNYYAQLHALARIGGPDYNLICKDAGSEMERAGRMIQSRERNR